MSEPRPAGSPCPPDLRRPVSFGNAPRRCTGWLHGGRADVGVVICAPLGAEEESAHRSLLHLACGLARRGMRVLRFDYPGCGDSEGDTADGTRIDDWVDAAVAAAEFLRESAGCSRIGFVGLRMGCVVAGMASARAQARWLALWAPVTSGLRHARELRAIAALGAGARQTGAGVEIAGHVLATGFVDTLGRVQCQDWQLAGVQRVLLLERDDAEPDSQLREFLQATGVGFDAMAFAGCASMFDDAHRARVPDAAITALCDWFAATTARVTQPAPGVARPDTSAQPAEAYALRADDYVERPMGLGTQRRVFGVLCSPAVPDAEAPLLILLNAGSVHHIGPGRLYVRVARMLAARGIPSLRIDLPALGDSLVPGMRRENDSYAGSTIQDMVDVFDDVKQRLGFRRMQLAGLCSGAYWALQVAMDPRAQGVEAVAMINPLVVQWSAEPQRVLSQSAAESIRYRKALLRWSSWKKLFTLRASMRSALGVVARQGLALAGAWLRGAGQRLGVVQGNAVEQGLRRLRHERVVLGLFIGAVEPGLLLLRQAAPLETRTGLRRGAIRVFGQPDADHTFTSEGSKQRLFRDLHAFVTTARRR